MNGPLCHSIEIRDLGVRFGQVEVLRDVNADILCGSITALIGPNGAGKTTLLKAILGLVPFDGTVRFCRAEEHGGGRPRIGYVPQKIDLDRNAPVTVLDLFAASTPGARPVFLGASRAVRAKAVESLSRTGASHLVDRRLGPLSGGEVQRVLLALALAGNPDLLLLDEPVSGIDAAGEDLFCDLLDNLQRSDNFALLLVSHDLSVVSNHADRVVCLDRTVVCEGATAEVLTSESLVAMYGEGAHLLHHGHAHGQGHLHVHPECPSPGVGSCDKPGGRCCGR